MLEFWATWCVPCVQQIPPLNALVEQFRENLSSSSASQNEAETALIPFLASHPMEGIVGIDKDGATSRAYDVGFLPTTVLIDRQGRLAAVSTSANITAGVLNKLIAGEPPDLPRPLDREPSFRPDAMLVKASIRASDETDGDIGGRSGKLFARASDVRDLLSTTYQFPREQIQIPSDFEHKRYDLLVEGPGLQDEQLQAIAQQLIPPALKLTINREKQTVPVLILSKPDGANLHLKPTVKKTGFSFGGKPGFGDYRGVTVTFFARLIQRELHQIVVDETGISGRYDISLKWDPDHSESLLQAVREQLGLSISEGKRPVELLVARQADSQAEQH
jgi:uncharacterized protein (TIGR03435 family)